MYHKPARSGWSLVSAIQIVSLCVLIAFSLVSPLIPAARAATTNVSIVNFQFQQADITIQPGDTVNWTNTVSTQHSVVSDTSSAETFSSGTLNLNDYFTHTFNTPGDFGYHCGFHPSIMTGTVHVSSGIPEFSSFALVMLGMVVLMIGLTAILRRR